MGIEMLIFCCFGNLRFYLSQFFFMFICPNKFCVFLKNRSKGLLGINITRWCTQPIKDRNFFRFEGDDKFSIASALLDNGVMPVWVMLCPSHSILSFAKWQFARLIRRFSWSNFIKHFCTRFRWFSIRPLLTISKSPRKQNVLVRPAGVKSIAFWNSAGVSVSPWNQVLKQ